MHIILFIVKPKQVEQKRVKAIKTEHEKWDCMKISIHLFEQLKHFHTFVLTWRFIYLQVMHISLFNVDVF